MNQAMWEVHGWLQSLTLNKCLSLDVVPELWKVSPIVVWCSLLQFQYNVPSQV